MIDPIVLVKVMVAGALEGIGSTRELLREAGLQSWLVLVNAEMEELEIRPTHRLLLEVNPEALAGLAVDDDPRWHAIPVPPPELAARLVGLRDAGEPVFGLVLPGDRGFLLVAEPLDGSEINRENGRRAGGQFERPF